MSVDVEYALEVSNLVVRYREIKSSSFKRIFKEWKTPKLFTAVNGISFRVPKGEIWGIIGKNGSGKSTTLNAVAGIFSPDEGYIDLKGNSVSLLSIGVGFQKSLSGRDNILLAGMLLGFSEKEMKKRMDEIIEFSELEDFIDKPVKTYSSGMYSKLAFSITAILETDIILIDEVLSVGDEHFKKKSFKKMQELVMDSEHTVLIVSHNMNTLMDLCTKVMWMHQGKIKMIGEPEEVLAQYKDFMN